MNPLSKTTIVLFIAFFSVSSTAAALEPAIATDDVSTLNLNRYIELLEDPTGNLTIKNVSSPEHRSKFELAGKDIVNFGDTESVYRVRLKIQNLSLQNESWLLETRPANINHIEIYKPVASGGFTKTKTEVSFPVSSREVRHHRFIFNLSLPLHQIRTFNLRIQNDEAVRNRQNHGRYQPVYKKHLLNTLSCNG